MTEINKGTEETGFEIKIKNISWDAKQEDVETFLKSFTSVVSIKLLVNLKNDRSKGYAYATLADQESLDKALSTTELEHFGRKLMIMQAKPKGEKTQLQQEQQQQYQQKQTSLYVGNLNLDANEEQLKEFFKDCGVIKGVKVVVLKNEKDESKEVKVFGFIDFETHEALEEGLKLDGTTVGDKQIQVSYKRQQSGRRNMYRRNMNSGRRNNNNNNNNNYRGDSQNYRGDGQRRQYDNRPQQRRQYDRDYDRRDNRSQYQRDNRDDDRSYDRREDRNYDRRDDRNQTDNRRQYQGDRRQYQGQRNEGQRYEGQRNEGQRNEGRNQQSQESSSIYVGNLDFNTDEQTLREAFEQYGQINEIRIVTDRNSGRSKGFGFINFQNGQSAKKALDHNEQEVDGRAIKVDLQQQQQQQRPRNNNYGGNDEYRGNRRGGRGQQRGGYNDQQ